MTMKPGDEVYYIKDWFTKGVRKVTVLSVHGELVASSVYQFGFLSISDLFHSKEEAEAEIERRRENAIKSAEKHLNKLKTHTVRWKNDES